VLLDLVWVEELVRRVEANMLAEEEMRFDGTFENLEGHPRFKDCVPGTHIVDQKCELMPGVLEAWRG
jgi:hypothetical protein